MKCPECSEELEFVSGEFGTSVRAPDGVEEVRHEEFYSCHRCRVNFDPSDVWNVEPEPELAIHDPDHFDPSKGGNVASDDYW